MGKTFQTLNSTNPHADWSCFATCVYQQFFQNQSRYSLFLWYHFWKIVSLYKFIKCLTGRESLLWNSPSAKGFRCSNPLSAPCLTLCRVEEIRARRSPQHEFVSLLQNKTKHGFYGKICDFLHELEMCFIGMASLVGPTSKSHSLPHQWWQRDPGWVRKRSFFYGTTCYKHLLCYQWQRDQFMDWWNSTGILKGDPVSFKGDSCHWWVCCISPHAAC